MKKIKLVVLLFMLISVKMYGINNPKKSTADSLLKRVYLGTGTGVNNYNGILGVTIKGRVVETLYVRAGLGTGSWGFKLSAGVHYDLKPMNCWGFGLGYSICMGTPEISLSLETMQGNKAVTKTVLIEYLPASTVNLTASRHWTIKKKNNIYLDLGYAVPLVTNAFRVKDDAILSTTSKAAINFMQPGGLIIGLGFMFGL